MNDHDERLRSLVHDAVSDVEPRPALGDIRSRTAGTRPRGWVWGAGAAVVATAATIAAMAVFGGNPGTTTAQDDPGFADNGSAPPTSSTQRPPGEVGDVPVYYVGDTGRGPRLFREFHEVTFSDAHGRTDALTDAVSGPPQDPEFRTEWPEDVFVGSTDRVSGVTRVHLATGGEGPGAPLDPAAASERPDDMSDAEARVAVQQLVYTAQDVMDSQDPVRFTIDARPATTILGVPVTQPVVAADPAQVLAQVWIDSPRNGAVVESDFEVTGLANAFEANVQWELVQGGEIVKSGFTTAEECCTMSPYSFTVKAPPGEYTLVVHDSDPSGGEGFPPWRDTKQITVE